MSRKESQRQTRSIGGRIVHVVVTLPRLVRILLVTLFALAVTVLLTPLIDIIYADNFFSETTLIVPALLSAAFGATMYLFGWWLIVGTVGEEPAPRALIIWYCGVGVFAIVLVMFLIVRGINLVTYFT